MAITLLGFHRVEMISNLKSNALFLGGFQKINQNRNKYLSNLKKFLQQIGKVALEKYVQK